MRIDLDDLPTDPELLQQLVRDLVTDKERRDGEIDKLRLIIKQLQRHQFGRRSEKLDPDQLALGFEDLDADIGRAEEKQTQSKPSRHRADADKPAPRGTLPAHLPRHDVVHDVGGSGCPSCGGTLHTAGETTSEMLDWVPASLRVIRIRRPKYGCRGCGTIHQAAAPERTIAKGLATPALHAQVLIAKYCDHTPLYRQSQIFARHGVSIDRSTLARWVGGACWWLEALQERIAAHILASSKLFADDTPVPVLDPGRGRTKTGRLWVYVRDDRPWMGADPPAALYRFSPDRKGERPAAHLNGFAGALQVDGYQGFERLTGDGTIVLAACWAHTRRKFYDVFEATQSPIAAQALERIGKLYEIESAIRATPADARRLVRQAQSRTLVDAMKRWLELEHERVPGRSRLAEAIRYALNRWDALTRFIYDGRIELDTNPVERAIRPVALGRKNHLFAGSDGGGARWATVSTLIETCKLNGVEPYAYLTDVLTRMVEGHPASKLDELLPWNWKPTIVNA
jgi:transposase